MRRKRNKNREENAFNYCNSLPNRKIKKKNDRGPTTLAGFKSTANLPDAIFSIDSGNNLSIFADSSSSSFSPNRNFSLQTSSKQQSLPLPPIPAPKPKRSTEIYRPSSVVSRSSCSTTENKYETIGKSLSPYKISDSNASRPPTSTILSNKNSSSTKMRSSLDSSSFSSGSPSADSDQGYGFASSSVSPMSLGNISGVESSSKSNKCVSSHYAQISPLRGEGLPPPGRMGLVPMSSSASSSNTNPNSPVKSYFQVCHSSSFQVRIEIIKILKMSFKTFVSLVKTYR